MNHVSKKLLSAGLVLTGGIASLAVPVAAATDDPRTPNNLNLDPSYEPDWRCDTERPGQADRGWYVPPYFDGPWLWPDPLLPCDRDDRPRDPDGPRLPDPPIPRDPDDGPRLPDPPIPRDPDDGPRLPDPPIPRDPDDGPRLPDPPIPRDPDDGPRLPDPPIPRDPDDGPRLPDPPIPRDPDDRRVIKVTTTGYQPNGES